MEKTNSKNHFNKDTKIIKFSNNSSKNKKQLKHSSSKNIKILKSTESKTINSQEARLKQETSPNYVSRGQQENDYGVNTFYAKYKVKTSKKKESEDEYESTDYGNFNSSRDTEHIQQFWQQKKGSAEKQQSDYATNAFQKLKLPNSRALINADGKFVNQKKQAIQKNYSFKEQSKNSFSLNYTSKDGSKRKMNKSKQKLTISNKSLDQKSIGRSGEKHFFHQHHSYYEKSKNYSKKKKSINSKQTTKINEISSKAAETSHSSYLIKSNFIVNDDFMREVKQQIIKELQASQGTIRKQRITEVQLKQRWRCLHLLAKICSALSMKRETFFLTIFYIDQYIGQYSTVSMRIVALGALTLALKMDDAQMTSKFCFQYLYNPQKTVKRNSSGVQLKIKQKQMKQVINDPRQIKNKLTNILSFRICEDKKGPKEDYSLDEVLDFETQIMIRLSFKLVTKTVNYWIDIFTTLWDGFVNQYKPQYYQILQFRNSLKSKTWSYLLQLIQFQFNSMVVYNFSKINLVLGGVYLVMRMILQQKKQQTPWEQLCRYYRASLSKSTNLIFCDGIGINPLFGDFLNLFGLGMSSIVDCIQLLSRSLLPDIVKTFNYSQVQGKNRQDKLSTYQYNEQLYKLL